ncbi:ATP-binding protein [Slackia exigua]
MGDSFDMKDMEDFLDASSESRLRVESDLGDGFVRLRVTEAQKRQAKQDIRSAEDVAIELLRNARDAGARTIFFATSLSKNRRTMVLVDDGAGIPERMWDAVFEPRVTSKLDALRFDDWGVHGRGMALYSISQNVSSARVMRSAPSQGTAVRVDIDPSTLSERSDQSTLPCLVKAADGHWTLSSSPHSIVRIAAEFALGCRRDTTVYFGSIVSIAATMRAYGKALMRREDECERPFASMDAPVRLLSAARNADELRDKAASLGLDLSSRSAYRIMSDGVSPLDPLLGMLERVREGDSTHAAPVKRRRVAIRIDSADLDSFSASVKGAYADLAERYYLDPDAGLETRVARDGIHVFIPFAER